MDGLVRFGTPRANRQLQAASGDYRRRQAQWQAEAEARLAEAEASIVYCQVCERTRARFFYPGPMCTMCHREWAD